jgi:hypothetical protein
MSNVRSAGSAGVERDAVRGWVLRDRAAQNPAGRPGIAALNSQLAWPDLAAPIFNWPGRTSPR